MRSCRILYVTMLCAATAGVSGCVGGGDPSGSEDVGVIGLAIAAVPTGIRCIHVDVATATNPPTTLASQNFATTAGTPWTGSLSLGSFTRGQVNVNAQAYTQTCSGIA